MVHAEDYAVHVGDEKEFVLAFRDLPIGKHFQFRGHLFDAALGWRHASYLTLKHHGLPHRARRNRLPQIAQRVQERINRFH